MEQWNAKLYDNAHSFVSQYGHKSLELLNPQPDEFILDLGCGTGDIAYELHKMNVNVTGVDYSETMIQKAKSKYPNVDFQVQNILSLDFQEQFDAVFSNAVLHWVKQPKQALERIYTSLKQGGRFVAEFGGYGNIENITDCMIQVRRELGYAFTKKDFPWYFPSIGEYTSLMEQIGFKVEFASLIDRPTKLQGKYGLRKWLNMFAEHFFLDVTEADKEVMISRIEQSLTSNLFHEDAWEADYKRLRIKGIRTSAFSRC